MTGDGNGRWKVVVLGVLLALAAYGAVSLLSEDADDQPESSVAGASGGERPGPSSVVGGAGSESGSAEADPAFEADEASEPGARRITRERWIELLAEIQQARGEAPTTAAEAEAPAAEAGSSSDTPGTLDPEYIQQAVRDVAPLIQECYELALEEEESLQGRLVMRFTIGGEPDLGGVVEDSAVDEESELRHPVLDECVRETLYTIELPAPEEGGVVEVRYPFQFSNEEPEP